MMEAKVAARIAIEMSKGATTAEAFDIVLGAGAYDAFVSDLYDALRKKAGVA